MTTIPYFFTKPEDETALLSPETDLKEEQALLDNELSSLKFLNGEKNYKDQGIVSYSTIFFTFITSLIALSLLIYFSPSSQTNSTSTPTLSISNNNNITFPYTPSELFQQCHDYYTLEKMPDHSGKYLESGSKDLIELELAAQIQEEGVCNRTLTYLLDGEVGLFYHLLLIAQSYSLAKLSNRSFFIDDTLWDRGKWLDHFQPLPETGCKRPSNDIMKGCPRGTRHWVVSSGTVRFHFAHQYQAFFEDPKGHDVWRKKKMFQMARNAFDNILTPSDINLALIQEAEKILIDENGERENHIGVHLRRGDKRPMSWKYRNDYIPLENFVEAIEENWNLSSNPTILLATDTPSLINMISNLSPSNFTYLTLNNSSSLSLKSLSSPTSYYQSTFSNYTSVTERILLTRGMLIDFSLLSGSWGVKQSPMKILCTLSSNICKMAAVALGWDESFEQNRWINLDGGANFDWRPTDVAG